MRWSCKTVIGLCTAIIAFAPAPLAIASPDPVETKVSHIRDAFVAAARKCNVTPRFEPAVAIVNAPSVIAYNGKSRTLIIGKYAVLPEPIKQFLSAWAAHDLPGKSGADLFHTLFNGFLVGHELGHWASDQSGRLTTLDHYEAEVEANQFAIAFAMLHDPSGTKTATMVQHFSYLSTLPNPVPVGEDARHFFNERYDILSKSDPIAYNWFQGQLMREAWSRRHQYSFCDLMKLPPLPDPS